MNLTTCNQLHFNSQPHKEADVIRVALELQASHFNSQPHKEADDFSAVAFEDTKVFQLTASQGG